MASVNKVILIGRLGKDPEIKYAPSGLQIANFSIATSENIKRGDNWEERTEWHNIVLFNKQAEYAGEYMKKGNMVYLEGKIQTRSWDDDKGVKRYKTEIVGNIIRNLSPRNEGASQGQYTQNRPQNYDQQQNTAPQNSFSQPQAQPQSQPQTQSHQQDTEDDLPF